MRLYFPSCAQVLHQTRRSACSVRPQRRFVSKRPSSSRSLNQLRTTPSASSSSTSALPRTRRSVCSPRRDGYWVFQTSSRYSGCSGRIARRTSDACRARLCRRSALPLTTCATRRLYSFSARPRVVRCRLASCLGRARCQTSMRTCPAHGPSRHHSLGGRRCRTRPRRSSCGPSCRGAFSRR